MKKKTDPLWTLVGEDVWLQGSRAPGHVTCPDCQVTLELSEWAEQGQRVRCGLCGATVEINDGKLVSDDRST